MHPAHPGPRQGAVQHRGGQSTDATPVSGCRETFRVGGMLLVLGILHGLNVLSLPVIGRLLGLARHLEEDTHPTAA